MPRIIELHPGESVTLADGTVVKAVSSPAADLQSSLLVSGATMTSRDALKKAIKVFGSQSALAADIGAHKPDLSDWLSGHRKVPDHRCKAIEKATCAHVTVEELRPDLNWIRLPDKSWPHPGGRPLIDVARQVSAAVEA